jgi:YhcH/YjgK/YiaL family protein
MHMAGAHMILDTLDRLDRYRVLGHRFGQAIDYLQQTNLAILPSEKQQLDGDSLFFFVVREPMKSLSECLMEYHRRYADIQVVLGGTETYGWSPAERLSQAIQPYDDTKDCALFEDRPQTLFMLQPGQFCIFFPDDGHTATIGEGDVHKLVMKVAL